jgi:tetratricopeptide (TPR) repeat protein
LSSEKACAVALQSLHELSLVRSQPNEDGRDLRYWLLVPFREYGDEKLTVEESTELRERHAEFFLSQAPQDRPFSSVDEQTLKHLAIELDYDNFISAIEYSLETGKLERCVRLLGILAIRWLARGPKATERRLIRQIADRPELTGLSAQWQVQVQRMSGTTFIRSGEYQSAYEACSRAIQIATGAGDNDLLATCYSGLSICAGYLGRAEECLELNRKVLKLAGSNLVLAERSYLGMGTIFGSLGQFSEASNALDKARTISERLRGGEPDALIVINQASIALDQERNGEALRLAHEAIRISRRLKDEFTLAVALTVVSRYHKVTGNLEAAVATNLEALERCKQGDFLYWILECLRSQAILWVEMGRFKDAATLLATTMESTSTDRSSDDDNVQKAIQTIKNSLTPRAFETAWAKGLAMNRSDSILFVTQNQWNPSH